MKIVSMSMNDDLFEEIESIKKDLSFRGRSEILRQGISLIREEARHLEKLKGHVDCVMMIMHANAERDILKLLHKNERIITTQLHSKLCNDKCLEIFVLHGPSDKIRELYNNLKVKKKLDFIKLVVP